MFKISSLSWTMNEIFKKILKEIKKKKKTSAEDVTYLLIIIKKK